MTHHTCKGALALCALLSLAGAAYAQTAIVSAAANSSLTTITITGRALQPASGPRLVSLGGQRLSVVSFSNIQINASLPAGLTPGSYDLAVAAKGAANFDLTIGAAGPAGPAGAPGATGPQGAPGPAGTIALPFVGGASANQPMFETFNQATGQQGIQGAGGPGSSSAAGGRGVPGSGGYSSGGLGGAGVYGAEEMLPTPRTLAAQAPYFTAEATTRSPCTGDLACTRRAATPRREGLPATASTPSRVLVHRTA